MSAGSPAATAGAIITTGTGRAIGIGTSWNPSATRSLGRATEPFWDQDCMQYDCAANRGQKKARILSIATLIFILTAGLSSSYAAPNCKTGKACGDSCIAQDKECHIAPPPAKV